MPILHTQDSTREQLQGEVEMGHAVTAIWDNDTLQAESHLFLAQQLQNSVVGVAKHETTCGYTMATTSG
jgi:hypothetical protein